VWSHHLSQTAHTLGSSFELVTVRMFSSQGPVSPSTHQCTSWSNKLVSHHHLAFCFSKKKKKKTRKRREKERQKINQKRRKGGTNYRKKEKKEKKLEKKKEKKKENTTRRRVFFESFFCLAYFLIFLLEKIEFVLVVCVWKARRLKCSDFGGICLES
jgi:hypothetical protein